MTVLTTEQVQISYVWGGQTQHEVYDHIQTLYDVCVSRIEDRPRNECDVGPFPRPPITVFLQGKVIQSYRKYYDIMQCLVAYAKEHDISLVTVKDEQLMVWL